VGHCRLELSRVPPLPVPSLPFPRPGAFGGAALPESSPLPWPAPRLNRLGSPWSLAGSHPARQDARGGDGRRVAPRAQRETPLPHPRSATSTGRRRRGSPVMTTGRTYTGTQRCLARHTTRVLVHTILHLSSAANDASRTGRTAFSTNRRPDELTHSQPRAKANAALRAFHSASSARRWSSLSLPSAPPVRNKKKPAGAECRPLPVLSAVARSNCLTPVITAEFLVSSLFCGVRSRALNAQHKLCKLCRPMSTPYFRDVSACDTLDMNGDVS